ncbi:hypothetical protein [Nocardia xishanensis]|uniref:Uncharacterized protein n=1 Tax=Nocardia xishanensis TaxID=238964 RepID=A0ABW7XBH7_9NOCA
MATASRVRVRKDGCDVAEGVHELADLRLGQPRVLGRFCSSAWAAASALLDIMLATVGDH